MSAYQDYLIFTKQAEDTQDSVTPLLMGAGLGGLAYHMMRGRGGEGGEGVPQGAPGRPGMFRGMMRGALGLNDPGSTRHYFSHQILAPAASNVLTSMGERAGHGLMDRVGGAISGGWNHLFGGGAQANPAAANARARRAGQVRPKAAPGGATTPPGGGAATPPPGGGAATPPPGGGTTPPPNTGGATPPPKNSRWTQSAPGKATFATGAVDNNVLNRAKNIFGGGPATGPKNVNFTSGVKPEMKGTRFNAYVRDTEGFSHDNLRPKTTASTAGSLFNKVKDTVNPRGRGSAARNIARLLKRAAFEDPRQAALFALEKTAAYASQVVGRPVSVPDVIGNMELLKVASSFLEQERHEVMEVYWQSPVHEKHAARDWLEGEVSCINFAQQMLGHMYKVASDEARMMYENSLEQNAAQADPMQGHYSEQQIERAYYTQGNDQARSGIPVAHASALGGVAGALAGGAASELMGGSIPRTASMLPIAGALGGAVIGRHLLA